MSMFALTSGPGPIKAEAGRSGRLCSETVESDSAASGVQKTDLNLFASTVIKPNGGRDSDEADTFTCREVD